MRGEHLVLVGGDEHVVFGRTLREDRDLLLHLDDAGIGLPCAAGILEQPLLDDPRAKALGRPPIGVRQQRVARMRPVNQQPTRPAAGHEILGQRIGQHAPGRRDVDHIGAALLLTQPVVLRGDIEQCDAVGPAGIGERQQPVGVEIGQQQPDAGPDEPLQQRRRFSLLPRPARRKARNSVLENGPWCCCR